MPSRHVYPFEKLRVWDAARHLTVNTYSATRGFPRTEIYGLTSQIAYGSLMELACLFILAVDLGFLATAKESALREQIESVSRQLNALRNAQIS